MKFSEVKITGLSYSQSQSGSYVLVLSEKKGKRKIPVIIKPSEAQFIAVKLENMKTQKPLTHDLVRHITDKLGADLYEVKITHILEGIFYSKLIFHNMVEEFEIECSIGDAMCMSVSYKCPVICSEEVLNFAGIEMEDDGSMTEEQIENNHKDRDISSVVSVENLQKMLDKAIESEEYEIASQLRDRINELKEKTK